MASHARTAVLLLALVAIAAGASAARKDPVEADLKARGGYEQVDGCPKLDACRSAAGFKTTLCNDDKTKRCSCVVPPIYPPFEWTYPIEDCKEYGEKCDDSDPRSASCVSKTESAFAQV